MRGSGQSWSCAGGMCVRRTVTIPAAATGVGVVISVLIATGVLTVGVPGEWVWTRVAPVSLIAAVPALVVGLGVAGGLAALARYRGGKVAGVLCLLVVGGFLLQLAVGYVSVLPLSGEAAIVTIVPYIGGYFYQATRVDDTWQFVREYAEWMRPVNLEDRVLGHLGDHPPGLVVFYVSAIRLMEACPVAARAVNRVAATLAPGGEGVAHAAAGAELTRPQLAAVWLSGWLLRFCMALTVLPFYGLARRVCERDVAVKCAMLFTFVPAFYVFSPSPDQLFVMSSVLIAHLMAKAWQERKVWPAALGGCVLFVALNLTVALVVLVALGGIAGALSARVRMREGEGQGVLLSRVGCTVSGVVGGFLIVLVACRLGGYDAVEVWVTALRKHSEFGTQFHRTYWKWLLVNPLEFWAFFGIPAGGMVLWRLAGAGNRAGVRGLGRDVPLLSLVALLLVLNLSGKNLGEVARLWMFLMPFAALGAREVLRKVGVEMVAVLAAAQVIQIVALKLCLDVFSIRMLSQTMPG